MRGVGIQGSGIEVGTVGQFVRISSEKAADETAGSGICGQRSSLIARRDQDISVDHTANLAAAEIAGQNAEAGYRSTEANSVLVAMGGQHRSDLKVSAGVEGRVLMEIKQLGMPNAGARASSKKDWFRGRLAVLGGKIADFHRRLGDDYDRTAQTNVRLFLGVVIDLIDLHVLVALRGTGRRGVGHVFQHRFGHRCSRRLFGRRRNLLRPSRGGEHKSSEQETGWDGLQAVQFINGSRARENASVMQGATLKCRSAIDPTGTSTFGTLHGTLRDKGGVYYAVAFKGMEK